MRRTACNLEEYVEKHLTIEGCGDRESTIPRKQPSKSPRHARQRERARRSHGERSVSYRAKLPDYFPPLAVIGGSGRIGSRFGSPRAPRTSTSSNRSEGTTTAAGRPLCALPKAPSAVPAMPLIW